MNHQFDNVSVHLLDVRLHGREQVPHPGNTSCEDALVLTPVGTRYLYSVTIIEHCSHAPYGVS
ncbi:hypothetical protein E2C01_037284 [Portunus trituberculatus]|uniref:Uncharacterized protein n=1 Tax=Portunus trituberculatus TaxID=210409 RepID=A0A5B7FB04_PORTR|nr:hypothetical protein [Portunus trituberculatus]